MDYVPDRIQSIISAVQETSMERYYISFFGMYGGFETTMSKFIPYVCCTFVAAKALACFGLFVKSFDEDSTAWYYTHHNRFELALRMKRIIIMSVLILFIIYTR